MNVSQRIYETFVDRNISSGEKEEGNGKENLVKKAIKPFLSKKLLFKPNSTLNIRQE